MSLRPAGVYQDSELCRISSGLGNGELRSRPQPIRSNPYQVPTRQHPLTDAEREAELRWLAKVAPASFGEPK